MDTQKELAQLEAAWNSERDMRLEAEIRTARLRDEIGQLQTVIDQDGETISRVANRLAATQANWERQVADIAAALGGTYSGADGSVVDAARRVVRERDEALRDRDLAEMNGRDGE